MNVSGRIGGDSNLSPQGRQFAQNLGDFVEKIRKDVPGRFHVWTSALKRTQETATIADLHYEPWKGTQIEFIASLIFVQH
jgi:6-phosphofructo-2-kinase/fructose-2,6-biphosphatase 2